MEIIYEVFMYISGAGGFIESKGYVIRNKQRNMTALFYRDDETDATDFFEVSAHEGWVENDMVWFRFRPKTSEIKRIFAEALEHEISENEMTIDFLKKKQNGLRVVKEDEDAE